MQNIWLWNGSHLVLVGGYEGDHYSKVVNGEERMDTPHPDIATARCLCFLFLQKFTGKGRTYLCSLANKEPSPTLESAADVT